MLRERAEVLREVDREERVLHDLRDGDALDWVHSKHAVDKALGVRGKVSWQVVHALWWLVSGESEQAKSIHTANLREQRLHVVVLKRQPAAEHDIQDYAATPYVDFRASVQSAADDLGGGIVGASAARLQEVTVLDFVRQAEVSYFDVQVVVEKDVLGLQISMYYLEMVAVLNAGYELLEEPTRLRFGHAPVRNDIVEEFAACVLEYNDDVCGGRDDFISREKLSFCDLRDNELARTA